MVVLGIETSCDDTSVAIVEAGTRVRSCRVASQIELHAPHGGVVPEIASRSHVEALPPLIESALVEAALDWSAIDAVAVTYGPGLSSSLLVGLAAAKGLAWRLGTPLLGVNHLTAHLYSPLLSASANTALPFPLAGLAISGGHTSLLKLASWQNIVTVGRTVDDAAGEAFDKAAILLGLGYPGGPAIERAARGGNSAFVAFPRGRVTSPRFCGNGAREALCMSFSGLKTSLRLTLREHPEWAQERLADLAASYQEAIVDAVATRCELLLSETNGLICGGGVMLNARLRARLLALGVEQGKPVYLPAPAYCGDNAAMIAGAAGAGLGRPADLTLDAQPNLDAGRDAHP